MYVAKPFRHLLHIMALFGYLAAILFSLNGFALVIASLLYPVVYISFGLLIDVMEWQLRKRTRDPAWLFGNEGRGWLKSEDGRKWLESDVGKKCVQTNNWLRQ